MRAKLAQLQLKDYRYHEVHLISNETLMDDGDLPEVIEYIPDVEIRGQNFENGEFAVFLKTRIDDECVDNYDKSPYQINVEVSGLFKLPEIEDNEESELEWDNLKYLNAPAILYSLTREKVNQLTANSIYGPVILPSINFVETMESADSDKVDANNADK